MGYALEKPKFTALEYFAWEETQKERHHYVRGEVFAVHPEIEGMSGGTKAHAESIGAAYSTLRAHLKGTPCRAFASEIRVQVDAADAYFYPDVLVTCAPSDLADPSGLSVSQPVLIIEVLSYGTASYDRGDKFADYRLLPSLKEYVLIDTHKRQIEVFRINVQNRWELFLYNIQNPQVELTSIAWQGSLDDLIGSL
jgi:Uma2 family endonuclease